MDEPRELYEAETGEKAMYRKESSDYHTLRYVRWLEERYKRIEAENERLKESVSSVLSFIDSNHDAYLYLLSTPRAILTKITDELRAAIERQEEGETMSEFGKLVDTHRRIDLLTSEKVQLKAENDRLKEELNKQRYWTKLITSSEHYQLVWRELEAEQKEALYWQDKHDRLKEAVEGEGLREAVAAVMHEVWVHWMWYLFSCGKVTVSTLAAAHWRKQMDAPYADLAEIEKESDREQADKVLAVLRAAIERQGGRRLA